MTGKAAVPGLVSVIMPFFNTRESFLVEAIESVKSQTYGNWELILIDDGSDVAVSNFAKQLADECSDKIKYVDHDRHENLGISASRNRGITAARGEFIAFLDGDDVWSERQLEEQMELLSLHPEAAMLYGNTVYWRSWQGNPGGPEEDFKYDLGLRLPQLVEPPRLLRLILQRRVVPPCMTCIIVRRHVFDDGETFENEFRGHYEDQVFVAKVATNYPVYVADRFWGKYRQHSESVTADGDDSEVARSWRLKYLQWLSGYLAIKGLQGTAVWHSLKLELWMMQSRQFERATKIMRTWWRRFRRVLGVPKVA